MKATVKNNGINRIDEEIIANINYIANYEVEDVTAGAVRGEVKKSAKVKVSDIFEQVAMLNPRKDYISSLGEYVSDSNRMCAEYVERDICDYLPHESLAFAILKEGKMGCYTTKQLWVIAYELLKSESYCEMLAKTLDEIRFREEMKRASKRAKRAAKKEAERKMAESQFYNSTYAEGDEVHSAAFGYGKVMSNDGKTMMVNFGGVERKLLCQFAKLTKIA